MDLFLLIFLLVLSALFSGTETAYFSLRQVELARLASERTGGGPRVVALVGQAHRLLSALLIGNLLVNTAASVVATGLCLRLYGDRGLAVAVPAVTIGLLICGEVTPKLVALHFRRPQALLMHRPLAFWLRLCRPLLALIQMGTDRLLRAIPWDRSGTRPLLTGELETACDLAVEDGLLTETEGRFLARLLLLRDLEVRRVMTPRPEVVSLHPAADRAQILATARQAGFNRYPVFAAEDGPPIGFYHLKDLLADDPENERPLAGGLRDLLFVPESKDVAALLTEMRTGGVHLAAVVDEHGDFSGIVTLADCLQGLIGPVGDIAGEDDPEVLAIGAGAWVVGGRLDLRELNEACGIALPSSRDYVTVAGYLMARLGRIPEPGDVVEQGDTTFTVLQMSDHKVVRVQVETDAATGEEAGT